MKRNKFSLSHTRLMSCDMGSLVPIGLTEVLPGDSIQQATTCLVRAAPLLAPVMHRVDVRIHHWFVPNRIIWSGWEDFITGGPSGTDASVPPYFEIPAAGAVGVGSLHDYMGVPPGTYAAATRFSMLPLRAYALIWNEWYRDQDLQSEVAMALTSGADGTTSQALLNCGWEKDYFTSARPWEQKGPSITLPLGTSATVKASSSALLTGAQTAMQMKYAATGNNWSGGFRLASTAGSSMSETPDVQGSVVGASYPSNLFADLSGASAITVTALREALALQRYEEARARFGSRYVEYLRYLGVRSSDARLQRPEYLGGGSYPIQFSEVLQTAEGTDPVGQMAGHGLGVSRSARYRRFFEEHGLIVSLLSVKPKTMYPQGLFRMWNRQVKEDYWQKELEHIGQMEVLNKEIYAIGATPDGIFGYQDRYDEYRRAESSVHGAFRPGQNLDYWNFARSFASAPALNADFVKAVPSEEPFAVPSENTLYVMARHSIQARRLVSQNGKSYIY